MEFKPPPPLSQSVTIISRKNISLSLSHVSLPSSSLAAEVKIVLDKLIPIKKQFTLVLRIRTF